MKAEPKWVKAKKSGNIYIRLPAGTFTCFSVGSRWGISWFPVGGKVPVYALEYYDTLEAARSAAEHYRMQVPDKAPEPVKPVRAQDYETPTREEINAWWASCGLQPARIPDEVLKNMKI